MGLRQIVSFLPAYFIVPASFEVLLASAGGGGGCVPGSGGGPAKAGRPLVLLRCSVTAAVYVSVRVPRSLAAAVCVVVAEIWPDTSDDSQRGDHSTIDPSVLLRTFDIATPLVVWSKVMVGDTARQSAGNAMLGVRESSQASVVPIVGAASVCVNPAEPVRTTFVTGAPLTVTVIEVRSLLA